MRTHFSRTEADAIKILLEELQRHGKTSPNEAKDIRKELRENYGYYISKFKKINPKANTVDGFIELINDGHITIKASGLQKKVGVATRASEDIPPTSNIVKKDENKLSIKILLIAIAILTVIIIASIIHKKQTRNEESTITTATDTITDTTISEEETIVESPSTLSMPPQKPAWSQGLNLEILYGWYDKEGLEGDEIYLTKNKKGTCKLYFIFKDKIIEERTCYKKQVKSNSEYILNDFCAGGAADEYFSIKKGTTVYHLPEFDGNESGNTDRAVLWIENDIGHLYKYDRSCYPACYEYFATLLPKN